ncbi:MAG: transposase [Lachnospiraceae bacterium]|nr:transposase [Lachnospiraceae bacterium]
MARKARMRSSSDTYHVMLRGVNRNQIFFEEEDFDQMIKVLGRCRKMSNYELLAYCLMGNHLHLLMRIRQEPMSTVFRRIGDSYVYWYNQKYERCGPLFQGRYKSEPVEDESYLLQVWRYILRNPVRAGICERPEDYTYSSAREYLYNKNGITDTGLIRGMLNEKLSDFLSEDDSAQIRRDTDYRPRLTEREAIQHIQEDPVPSDSEKELLTAWVKHQVKSGISIRQLSRLSGITKKRIERMLK